MPYEPTAIAIKKKICRSPKTHLAEYRVLVDDKEVYCLLDANRQRAEDWLRGFRAGLEFKQALPSLVVEDEWQLTTNQATEVIIQ